MSLTLSATLILLLTSACSSGPFLANLKADPVASYEAEGITEARRWITREGTVLGKPTYAKVLVVYHIEDQSQVDRVLEEAVAFAEQNGWRMEPSNLSPPRFRGSKGMGVVDRPGRLSIAVGPEDPLKLPEGQPWALVIILDHGI